MNPHHSRPTLQLLILPLQHIGRAHPLLMRLRQHINTQDFFAAFFQQPRHPGRFLLQLCNGHGQRRLGRRARGRFRDSLHQLQHHRTLLPPAQRQRVAHKMHLAALPHCALKMPLDGLHHPGVIVAHHIANAAQSALLQLAEDRAPTGFRLTLGHPAAQYFAITRRADPDSHQHALTDHLSAPPHLFVARVEDQVRIRFGERTHAPLGDLRIQCGGQRRYLALADLQPAQRLGNGAHLARRNALDIHLHQGQNKGFFAALVALEQLRLKLAIAVLGNHQLKLAHPRLQGARLVAVAPTAPLAVALVRLGAQETGHLGFQNLLHRALNQLPKKVFAANAALPSRQNLNTLSIASHLSHPPWKCRLGKQHPKESNRWLAHAHQSDASTEL
jgi:hypothetical protein